MEHYDVSGMSCAACSARVEKAVNSVDGVTSCSVSLLTNSMMVEGSADPAAICAAVEKAGYKASVQKRSGSSANDIPEEDALKDTETPKLIKRLAASIVFLLILMYLSMGHMMWGWPIPSFLEGNHVAMGMIQMLLAGIVMVINQKFFVSGFPAIFRGAPNMDSLVALGSAAAFIYSTVVLLNMTGAVMNGDEAGVMANMHDLYFESAAMIPALITVGKTLEARAKGRTTDALKDLMKLKPKTAVIISDGEEREVPIEQVKTGDVFVVRPGDNIPVDGIVISGSSAVDESALTGESIPADKKEGDNVYAATINRSGTMRCTASKVGEDTTLSQIISMVRDASATKAPIARIADKVAGVFVPIVIGIAVITVLVWLLINKDLGSALGRGIAVLVISCPCAMGLATPVAIMVSNGVGAKNGILFKTAASMEVTGRAEIVALDKTGTITSGITRVTDILTADGVTEEELLKKAYALENESEHPLALAIVEKAKESGTELLRVTDFEALTGHGIKGTYDGKMIIGGNEGLVFEDITGYEELRNKAQALAGQGKTPIFFKEDNRLLGVISVADTIKEDSREAISYMHEMGLKVVMITGDNERTANAIGREAGVDEVIAGVFPEGKDEEIKRLKEQGRTVMVGDGINDAPALTRADVGIAIGAGTDVAIDAADVVLMRGSLIDAANAIKLGRKTITNIHQNLFWAFIYNIIGIPLAAGVFTKILGWEMSPMFGALAMSLSSFCVVTNALRLNGVKLYKSRYTDGSVKKLAETGDPADDNIDDKNDPKDYKKEVSIMEKTIKVEGMMCGHCEARVNKALEALPFVESAKADHESGTVTMVLSGEADMEAVKQAVEAQDYVFAG